MTIHLPHKNQPRGTAQQFRPVLSLTHSKHKHVLIVDDQMTNCWRIRSEKWVNWGKIRWKNYGEQSKTRLKNYDSYLKSRLKKCIFVPG